MKLKKLFNLSLVIVFLATLVVGFANAQTRYLNSTDGDDSYTGENATNSPLGTGPKRTLEGAFTAFASGTTVHMAAGFYNFDQSGIGGGNDANGYTIGDGVNNKSMTFIVETYNANNTVTLNGGPLTIQTGTGTVAFQPAVAGTNTLSLAPAGASTLTLLSGTLDVSGFGAAGFAVSTNITSIVRTEGALVGTPSYAAGSRNVTYNGTTSKTAANELPANIQAGTLSLNQISGTVTFPNALTLTTGIIQSINTGNATFNGTVTGGGDNPGALQILNSSTGTLGFNQLVTLQARDANFTANVIDNTANGVIEFNNQLIFDHTASATAGTADRTATIRNNASGRITTALLNNNTGTDNSVTPVVVRIIVSVLNASNGRVDIGGTLGASEIRGTLTNNTAGTVNVNGPFTIYGVVSNANAASVINLGANTLTIAGVGAHTNTGTIAGTGNLLVTAGATFNGTGSYPNVEANATALVTINNATVINGSVTNSNTGGITLVAITTVTGSVNQNNNGAITFNALSSLQGSLNLSAGSGNVTLPTANSTTVQGSVNLNGGTGTLATNGGGNNLTINGSVTLNSGTLSLTGAGQTSVINAFNQNGGTLTWAAAGILDLKNNFVRNSGTVNPGTGTLQFTAGGSQQFTGGTNMRVYNFNVQSVGTGVTFNNGSLEVMNNATIIANTNVQLQTLNIRMLGLGANNIFTNGGQYTATGGGGIIFEGGGGTPGAGIATHFISGNGVNSNIEIRLANEDSWVDISDGQVVTWSGNLTLTRGTINVGNGAGGSEQFNPSVLLATPTIRRNLGDVTLPGGQADGRPITVGADGAFNATNQSYNLEYFGTLTANQVVGSEFVPGNPGRVINLTVSATAFAVQLGNNEYRFTGSLTLARGANLQLTGAGNNPLVSSGNAVTHTINGTISHTNTGIFRLDGTGTVTAGTDPLDQATIMTLTVNSSGAYSINNLKLIGSAGAEGLTVTTGTVNLMMLNDGSPVTPRDVRNVVINGGTTNLAANVEVTNSFAIATGGTFDLADFNVWLTGSSFTATGGTINATGATTNGYVQFRADAGLNTGAVLVPRIVIDPAAVGGIDVTLTGNSGVKDIFTNVNGHLELGVNTFTNAGTQWNTTGTYTGTGVMAITGNVEAKFSGNVTIPNLTVNNGANTFTLTDNDGAAGTVPTLSVSGLYTMTAGAVNLQTVDIALIGTGGVFTYTAGTLAATTTASNTATDNQNGELVFNNAGAQTFTTSAAGGLTIPNLRIEGAGGVSYLPAPNFTVSGRLVFGNSSLNFGSTGVGSLVLADGAFVERRGNGVLQNNPIFNGVVDVMYSTVAATAVDKEMPAGATILRDLFINVNTNASKNITVNRLLHLMAGTYDPEPGATTYTITMANGSTLNRTIGVIADNAAATFSVTGGPITLIYSNTLPLPTTSQEYPATAGFVSTLNVTSTATLTLHASRSCGDFVLNTGTAGPPAVNSIQFDLNGFTLNVTNATSATLTRGVLISNTTRSTLNVTGSISSTANTTVTNVNINAATASLAGAFTGGATATITGDATFATFAGNAVVGGNTTLNGVFTGSLSAAGDITASVSPALAAGSSLTLNGTADQDVTVVGSEAFTNLTLNNSKAGSSAHINWINNRNPQAPVTLTLSGTLALMDGILVFQNTTDALWLPTAVIPFTRVVAAGRQSHVVGNVTIPLGGPARYEYPVGSLTNYRKAVVEYPAGILTPSPLTVRFIDQAPGGENGFPITTFSGLSIDSTAGFSWLIKSQISQGISQTFNLELYAEGWGLFQDVDSTANLLRAIRRLDTGVQNPWTGQTGVYSNFVTSIPEPFPVLRVTATTGGIVAEGSHFTFGLESGFTPQFNLTGTVTYDNTANTPLSGVTVTLSPGGQTATTDASGQYTIADVANGSYTVTASSAAAWPGANATDALLISNHFNGTALLTGLRLTAADVNASTSVNNTDALLVVRRFAGLDNSFAAGDWVFTSANVTVNNDDAAVDLDGLAVGDVNGSDTPTLLKQGANTVSLSSNGKLQVNPTDAFEVSVKVSSAMSVGAFGLRFNYPSELVSFEGVSSKFSGTVYKAENNMITIAWADFTGKQAINLKETDALLTLKFKPTQKFEVGTKFNVELDGSYSELASSDGKVFAANLQVSSIESFVPADFGLRQNYPNPFNPSTTIEYDMPVAGNVSLIIYNILGEQVSVLVNEFQKAGAYKFNWVANNLPSGVYIYRLNVEAGDKNFSQNHRMMLLK